MRKRMRSPACFPPPLHAASSSRLVPNWVFQFTFRSCCVQHDSNTHLPTPPARDNQKHWISVVGQQAWWGWVSKPRAWRVSALHLQPPCRSAAPLPAAWPHSSSTAPALGRVMGAAHQGAGTSLAQDRGRGSRSRYPPGLRGPWQGPSPWHVGQSQGDSLSWQHLGSVWFSSPHSEEGL